MPTPSLAKWCTLMADRTCPDDLSRLTCCLWGGPTLVGASQASQDFDLLSVAGTRGRIGLSRRVSVVLRHIGLFVVPRLCASHENVGIGPEPAGIVQGADAKPDDVGASRDLHVERCATVAAETRTMSLPLSAFVTYRLGVPWRMRNPALGTRAAGTCAAPLWRWQSRQWQRRVKTGSPAVS